MTESLSSRIERDGYDGPFRALPVHEMDIYRSRIERVLATDGHDPRARTQSRHLDAAPVRELCTLPAIVERVHEVLGPSIVLWRSHFFVKEPGDAVLDWHRDADIWGSLLRPMRAISGWLAIDPATHCNACVEVLPRSDEQANPIPMELQPGEFFLFDERLLHRSGANASAQRRLGLAIRFTLPGVTIDRSRLFPGYDPVPLDRRSGR